MKTLALLLGAAPVFAQCGNLVVNPVTGQPDCTGTEAYYTASGAGAVTRTLQGKLSDYLSITDFGAIGDGGATDNKSPINNAVLEAITAGKALYVPSAAACYFVSGPIVLFGAVTIFGDGPGSCVALAGAANSHVVSITASSVIIRSVLIDGNKANQSPGGYDAIHVAAGLSWIALNDSIVQNAQGACIYLESDSYVSITGNTIAGCLGNGGSGHRNQISYSLDAGTNPTNWTVERNTISFASGGFYCVGMGGISGTLTTVDIEDNHCTFANEGGVETGGVYLAGAAATPQIFNVTVSRNTFTGAGPSTTSNIIEFKEVDRSTINHNIVTNGQTGILLANCLSCTVGVDVSNNVVTASGGTAGIGIYCQSVTKANVIGNTVLIPAGTHATGININLSSESLVSNNLVTGVGGSGGFGYQIYQGTHIVMRGNRAASTAYGFVTSSTSSDVVLVGNTCDNIAVGGHQLGCYNQPIPPGVSIVDDSNGLNVLGPSGTLQGNVPSCQKYTLSNNGTNWTVAVNGNAAVAGAAIPASRTSAPVLFNLPARGRVMSIRAKTTTAWSGTGFTSLGLTIGDSTGGATFYTNVPYNLLAAPSGANFQDAMPGFAIAGNTIPLLALSAVSQGATSVLAEIAGNQNLNASAITGVAEISVCWTVLP